MWFGTEAGLAKFDGRRTQAINDPALPTGRVLSLETDPDGALWIGTESGAARFLNGIFETIGPTIGQSVSAIIAPEPKRVVLATEQGQIFECRTGQANVITAKPLFSEPLQSSDRDRPGPLSITSLAVARNKLFAGTQSRGVLLIENGTAQSVSMRPMAYFVNALSTDADGKLWVGGRARKEEPGAFEEDSKSTLARHGAPTGPVMTIRTIDKEVWIGTDGRGVFRVSGDKVQRFTFDGTAGGLRSDHVYSIFPDSEGVIWFGTDRGVCRFDPQSPRSESVGDNTASNFVRTLHLTSNGLLLSGTNRGLFLYNNATESWRPIGNLARSIIYAIVQDKRGRLLVGSASGLFISDRPITNDAGEETSFTRIEAGSGEADSLGSVRSIVDWRGTTYFASYARGVERYENGSTQFVWQSESGEQRKVVSLLADTDSRLLIGTATEGVFSFDGTQTTSDPAFVKLKGLAVRAMERTNDGTLWFATSRGLGICKQGVECIVVAGRLDVRSVTANRNSDRIEVWCATGGGLLKVRLDESFGPIVSQLDVEQGLPSQNVFAVVPQRQENGSEVLLIGTNRGVARYQPGQTEPHLSVTRVLSKRVHAPSELQAGLALEYPQNGLLVDVTAVSSRTFPEQFQYAFTLTDSSNHVVKQKLSRESQFAMEGLKPGQYTVTARGFTKDLVASPPLSFTFSVAKAPFPWTSTALAILLGLALLALAWAIMERRRIAATSAALVDANRELADARLNLANEAERERGRIARDLHDQTLADLRHLALLTDQMKSNGAGIEKQTQTSALRTEIESISQEVRRICEDLSPSVLQNVGFAAALEFALAHAIQDAPPTKRFVYTFHCDEAIEERSGLSPSVQMQIYRIVQEAVNNIWRHAEATEVGMSVTAPAEGDFVLQLEDNGRPFDINHHNSEGRGLANMRARAGLIDAQIAWQKRDSGGTVFTLRRTREVVKA
jgi:signal transduction histidine kinase/ligand-binding sensor domain-containing protein